MSSFLFGMFLIAFNATMYSLNRDDSSKIGVVFSAIGFICGVMLVALQLGIWYFAWLETA